MSFIVLGLDVSRDRMGWGAVTLDEGRPVGCGVFDIRPTPNSDGLDVARPAAIRDALRELADQFVIPMHEPAAIYLEEPYVSLSGRVTVELAMAVGSAWQAVSRRWPGVPVEFLAPKEWKRLAHVTPDPKNPETGKALKGLELRWSAFRSAPLSPHVGRIMIDKPEKPYVYLEALEHGFDPKASQDAADAGLIALAGQRRTVETWDRGVEMAAQVVEAA